ncbi:alpha-N-acetylgalactosaminide alpha-2,6-sialyltransferase 5b isoform X1 [Gasterosteus aculeatus]
MNMKIRVCQGVSGIIFVTMVTSFMLVYNNGSFGNRSPSSSSPSSRRPNGTAPTKKKPDGPRRLPTPTLEGYTSVMDHKPLKMHCGTCALVTSSGQLTGSRRGEEIDRSECVIRMNDAPSVNHQRDVGRRTSLRVVAHSSLQRVLRSRQELLNASQDTVFVFWGPNSCMRRDGKGHVYNNLRLLKQLLPKLKVYIISRVKMLKFDELFKKETGIDRKSSNSWLSTGWFTMAIAVELCGRIDVYGMVPPDYCSPRPHNPPHNHPSTVFPTSPFPLFDSPRFCSSPRASSSQIPLSSLPAVPLLRALGARRVLHVPLTRAQPTGKPPPLPHGEGRVRRLGSNPRHPLPPAGLGAGRRCQRLPRSGPRLDPGVQPGDRRADVWRRGPREGAGRQPRQLMAGRGRRVTAARSPAGRFERCFTG